MYQTWPRIDENYFDLLHLAETVNYDYPSENVQNELLSLMVKSFKAESGQFCMHDRHHSTAKKEKTALLNLTWKYTDQYINYYHDLDPFIHIMPEVGAFRNQDLMPSATWRSCEFNEDFIRPQKVQHLLVMRLLDSQNLIGHIGLFRAGTSPAFSQKDLYRAQYLALVFSQKIKQQHAVQHSKELEDLLGQLKDVPGTGLTVLDSNLHPIFSNLKMMDFESSTAAQMNNRFNDGLCTLIPEEVMNECREIAQALRESQHSRMENKHIVIWQNQRQKVDVEICVLPSDLSTGEHSGGFYLLLMFNKATRIESGESVSPVAVYKLTPKEAEITKYICAGLSNKEISHKLFISLPTVATHVQHILHKTGISRRSQLISRLLS